MIQNIEIEKIYPHPDNPRKDLGDLTELAESIKTRGILQNLTIVPGCKMSDEKWRKLAAEYKENPNEELRAQMNNRIDLDGYTVIIGHRRLAAAKLAGLKELPCAISEMDYRNQVATMLLENMQRSDLTPIEQAQGFQMMIDLGETVSNISEKTGFSDTTIRKRLNLVKLDQKKLQESYLRGGTLMDYVELEKIKDVKLRNKVLEYIGTSNFKWQLTNAIDEEERPIRKDALIKELQEFAKPIKDSNGLYHIAIFYDFKKPEYYKKPSKNDKSEYFYKLEKESITLYMKEEKQAKKELSDEEKNFKKKEAKLKELSKVAYEMRHTFIRDFNAAKKYTKEIQYFAFQRLLQYSNQDIDKILESLEIEKPDKEGLGWEAVNALKKNLLIEKYNKSPEKTMLVVTYMTLGDSPSNKYYDAQSWNFKIEYSKNKSLDIIYSTLLDLGYEMSDEEKALQNGTHELFHEI